MFIFVLMMEEEMEVGSISLFIWLPYFQPAISSAYEVYFLGKCSLAIEIYVPDMNMNQGYIRIEKVENLDLKLPASSVQESLTTPSSSTGTRCTF